MSVLVGLGISGWLLCAGIAQAADLGARLAKLAPDADPHVISMAVSAVHCAEKHGQPDADRLAVIDYSKPSTKRRLWVFKLSKPQLLFKEWVAHGSATGGNKATHFSNKPGSHASSLGLFRTLASYHGRHGLSLRLKGLEPGINDNAYKRAIVIHSAKYATPAFIHRVGRMGRSWGCPAVRPAIIEPLVNSLKDGQYVFAYYPKPSWIKHSEYLHCSAS
ncbi:murein L,D-transpeptidase catalytic domain family protein [Salinisphaera sp. Q1T1-3]|uniref:murein L,D-transpeptidase catalytic domain family protein n=1 Tax=Salinisphaera sp. Q1T1-3 TaxID=2321229 RepID=UPI0018F54A9C|nr:murein L,D-transpeptidase catalytic domain family protein [Salinisphaera sp. Q1T1-3]